MAMKKRASTDDETADPAYKKRGVKPEEVPIFKNAIQFEWPVEKRLLCLKYKYEEFETSLVRAPYTSNSPAPAPSSEDSSAISLENKKTRPLLKMAAFDLDSTLIETNSGRLYAKDHADWKWLSNNIPTVIKKYHLEGYKIVIFSNQKGLLMDGPGGRRLTSFQSKLSAIVSELDIPCLALFALLDDHHRKPDIGMFTFLKSMLLPQDENPIPPSLDFTESFFVGDAAGRIHGLKETDHSDCDLLFAKNIGVSFFTPEQFFNIPRNRQTQSKLPFSKIAK
jgi:DNA 3'-phosphatase